MNLIGESGTIFICHPAITFDRAVLVDQLGPELAPHAEEYVNLLGVDKIKSMAKDGVFTSKITGKEFSLKEGESMWYDGYKSR